MWHFQAISLILIYFLPEVFHCLEKNRHAPTHTEKMEVMKTKKTQTKCQSLDGSASWWRLLPAACWRLQPRSWWWQAKTWRRGCSGSPGATQTSSPHTSSTPPVARACFPRLASPSPGDRDRGECCLWWPRQGRVLSVVTKPGDSVVCGDQARG